MNNLKISSQDIIEFSTCQNIEKAQNNLIGLIVKDKMVKIQNF